MFRLQFFKHTLFYVVLVAAVILMGTAPMRVAAGPAVDILMAEIYTNPDSGEMGRTIIFNNRGNKQLAGDFIPGDPNRHGGTPNITYHVDQTRPSADLSLGDTEAAIDRAMATWDAETCSNLGMTKTPFVGSSTGFVAAARGFGGSFDYVADVNHAGWLPGAFFDLLAPGGSGFILGVTFTIVYVDAGGNLVDQDNNNKYDVAWREIYYNDNFVWKINDRFDVQTIALHEAGHGLSQAHFGTAFRDPGTNQLHFSPRAVMNAAYSGVQQQIDATDRAGHCSNWSQWANR